MNVVSGEESWANVEEVSGEESWANVEEASDVKIRSS